MWHQLLILLLPAFWVGLMYDTSTLDAAWDLCKNWNLEIREEMRIKASVDGLQATIGDIKMIDLVSEVLKLSQAGLTERARSGAGGIIPNEAHFLNALQESVDTGMTPADELLEKYHGEWDGDIKQIYSDFSY